MKAIKNILGTSLIYAILWAVHHWGYARGADSEKFSREVANNKIVQCYETLIKARVMK